MKRIKTLQTLIVLIAFSCNEVDDLLTFAINDRTSITVASNASPITLPIDIPTPDVTTNSEQQYKNNNTAASLVKDVRLDELKLTITNPPTRTFSFLKSIRIYISSDQSGELELASAENIASNVNVLNLIPTQEKLDAYIKSPSYNLRTEVTTDEALAESVDIQVDLRFLVTADTF